MHQSGHSREQSMHTVQFSCTSAMTPRVRGGSAGATSGYSVVCEGRVSTRAVVASPRTKPTFTPCILPLSPPPARPSAPIGTIQPCTTPGCQGQLALVPPRVLRGRFGAGGDGRSRAAGGRGGGAVPRRAVSRPSNTQVNAQSLVHRGDRGRPYHGAGAATRGGGHPGARPRHGPVGGPRRAARGPVTARTATPAGVSFVTSPGRCRRGVVRHPATPFRTTGPGPELTAGASRRPRRDPRRVPCRRAGTLR